MRDLRRPTNRVLNCAKGAALSSGTILDTVTVLTGIHQRHSNKGMAETIQRNIELVGQPRWTEKEHQFAKSLQRELGVKETGYPLMIKPILKPSDAVVGGGSSDVGEVTLIAPTASVYFSGRSPRSN